MYFLFWLLGRSPKGVLLVTPSAIRYRVCHTDGLAHDSARADKCFKDDVVQSLQWCGKVVHCEKQQQQSERLSRKLLGLEQLVFSKGICPIVGEVTLMTVAGFVPESLYPISKDELHGDSREKDHRSQLIFSQPPEQMIVINQS